MKIIYSKEKELKNVFEELKKKYNLNIEVEDYYISVNGSYIEYVDITKIIEFNFHISVGLGKSTIFIPKEEELDKLFLLMKS